MKVILLEDVKSLGKKGDMVEVNNGYARNFILPKKLGVEATGKNINDLKLQKAHQDKRRQKSSWIWSWTKRRSPWMNRSKASACTM